MGTQKTVDCIADFNLEIIRRNLSFIVEVKEIKKNLNFRVIPIDPLKTLKSQKAFFW